jgi:hypothetical protein
MSDGERAALSVEVYGVKQCVSIDVLRRVVVVVMVVDCGGGHGGLW